MSNPFNPLLNADIKKSDNFVFIQLNLTNPQLKYLKNKLHAANHDDLPQELYCSFQGTLPPPLLEETRGKRKSSSYTNEPVGPEEQLLVIAFHPQKPQNWEAVWLSFKKLIQSKSTTTLEQIAEVNTPNKRQKTQPTSSQTLTEYDLLHEKYLNFKSEITARLQELNFFPSIISDASTVNRSEKTAQSSSLVVTENSSEFYNTSSTLFSAKKSIFSMLKEEDIKVEELDSYFEESKTPTPG